MQPVEDRDDRSRRHLGTERLAQVQGSRVLVVGAGALGNEVIKNLALLGVGHLVVVDFDRVSLSNLNRCVFFQPDQVGRSKVEALGEALALQAPDVRLDCHCMRIEDAPEAVWQTDLVLLCVDDQMARYHVNMQLLGREGSLPVVNGAMGRNFFEVQVLVPGETACLVCPWAADYHEKLFRRVAKMSCDQFFEDNLAPFPSISVLASLCGGIIASEAIALLAGGEPAASVGSTVRYEQGGHLMSVGHVHRNPGCVEVLCRRP